MAVYLCVMLALRTTTVYIHPHGYILYYTNTCIIIKVSIVRVKPGVDNCFHR